MVPRAGNKPMFGESVAIRRCCKSQCDGLFGSNIVEVAPYH